MSHYHFTTEYGVQFIPPHINAGTSIWLPDLNMCASFMREGNCILVSREVSEWTVVPIWKYQTKE